MEEQFGKENLRKTIMLVAEVGNVIDAMGRAKGQPDRLMPLLNLFDELTEFMTVDFEIVNKELEDLSAIEKDELLKELQEKFDIVDDKLEAVFEKSVIALANVYDLYKSAMALYDIIKK